MGRRESSDRRRRRPSYSSSHDSTSLVQRDPATTSQAAQRWPSGDTRRSIIPPPPPEPPEPPSAFQSYSSMPHYRRPAAPPVYEYGDHVDQVGYTRRRRSGTEPRQLHEGRRHHRHRRPEDPSSSDDDDDESWDGSPPKGRQTAIDSDIESSDEAPPQRGRRGRHERYIESSEESDMQGADVRTPSTSSQEHVEDYTPRTREPSRAPRRYSVKTIETVPAPRLVRPRVSSEVVDSRSRRSSRRYVYALGPRELCG